MSPEKQIESLERKITSLMTQIKNGEITAAQSKIGKPFNKLKELDLASYEKFLKQYKEVLSTS